MTFVSQQFAGVDKVYLAHGTADADALVILEDFVRLKEVATLLAFYRLQKNNIQIFVYKLATLKDAFRNDQFKHRIVKAGKNVFFN